MPGRIVVVGDRAQAIYGFRGADVDAMDRLYKGLEEAGGCTSLPLSSCRRCPQSHIRLAQQIVPEITWCKKEIEGFDAPEGEIKIIKQNLADSLMQEGDMGLSRVNAVLVPCAYALLRLGKKVIIRGRNIGEGLIALIDKLKPKDMDDFLAKLNKFYDKEVQKILKAEGVEDVEQLDKHLQKYEELSDKYNCLIAFSEGVEDLYTLRANIQKLFADFDDEGKPKQAIILSTVHRAKGLEAFNIFCLDGYNMPHKAARKPWQKKQEMNILYILLTRSKFVLGRNGEVIQPGRLYFIDSLPKVLIL